MHTSEGSSRTPSGQKRRSKQRDAVLRAVRGFSDHPDVKAVYNVVRREIPRVSLATVYRNLALLARQGDISEVRIGSDQTRFDNNLDDHGHLICRRCGTITDIDTRHLESRVRRSYGDVGYENLTVNIDIHGVCPACGAAAADNVAAVIG